MFIHSVHTACRDACLQTTASGAVVLSLATASSARAERVASSAKKRQEAQGSSPSVGEVRFIRSNHCLITSSPNDFFIIDRDPYLDP